MTEYPQTVAGIVARLKAEGVKFITVGNHAVIRAAERRGDNGWRYCPIAALTGCRNEDAGDVRGIPSSVRRAVILAADAFPNHDPAVRALLMTLVEP